MKARIGHVTIFGRDLKAMLEFYEGKLGLGVIARDADFHYAMLDAGNGVRLGLSAGEPNPDAGVRIGGLTGLGLLVPDVDAAHATLKARGVDFTMPPSRQPWGGYMAMFSDPDGNVLYLEPETT